MFSINVSFYPGCYLGGGSGFALFAPSTAPDEDSRCLGDFCARFAKDCHYAKFYAKVDCQS